MAKPTAYARTMNYLGSAQGFDAYDHSWERHHSGAHTIELWPADLHWQQTNTVHGCAERLRFDPKGHQTFGRNIVR